MYRLITKLVWVWQHQRPKQRLHSMSPLNKEQQMRTFKKDGKPLHALSSMNRAPAFDQKYLGYCVCLSSSPCRMEVTILLTNQRTVCVAPPFWHPFRPLCTLTEEYRKIGTAQPGSAWLSVLNEWTLPHLTVGWCEPPALRLWAPPALRLWASPALRLGAPPALSVRAPPPPVSARCSGACCTLQTTSPA